MLRFDTAIVFSSFLKSNLAVSLRIITCVSEVLLFSGFIIVLIFIYSIDRCQYSIDFYNCVGLIMLLCTFLVFFLIDTKNKQFALFHLISFLNYYTFLLPQELLVIFKIYIFSRTFVFKI